MTEILIIEDEFAIRRFLKTALKAQHFQPIETGRGDEGLVLAAERRPDIILLDLGLPDMDGLEVLRRLRDWTSVPIIILSARGQEQDKVVGLDSGADDYLTKPFSVAELLARIRVALRHLLRNPAESAAGFQSGGLKVDLRSRQVWLDGKEIRLSPIQYRLLAALVRNAGRVVTQRQLLKEVWDENSEATSDYVRIYIHQLRHKLEADPVRPRYLLTEPGVGYRLVCEDHFNNNP
jgi:two-component system KDP operon response regulator KdpE